MTDRQSKILSVMLSSGRQLEIQKVKLYPEPDLQKLLVLQAKAEEEFGGFSSGLAFIGSTSSVLLSSAALGMVESLISGSKEKKGRELLIEAKGLIQNIRGKGTLFDVTEIEGIEKPDPFNWIAKNLLPTIIDINTMGVFEKGKFLGEAGYSKSEIYSIVNEHDGLIEEEREVSFIHDGDEFLLVETNGQLESVRWKNVECFRVAIASTY